MKVVEILILVLSMVALSFAGAQAFSLYDGSGHKLGTFVYENTVYVPSWKKLVWFDTNPTSSHFGNIMHQSIYFTETGCNGDAYIGSFWLTEYVLQNGNEYWTGSKTNTPALSLSIKSALDTEGDCFVFVQDLSSGWKMEPFVPKKIPFTLPLTFPLSVGP